ncbi:MAG: hypothetical protein GX139_08835 [Armatimonadetes bacterium]|nr:hypothetical protein [Armatimonadota bacterium]
MRVMTALLAMCLVIGAGSVVFAADANDVVVSANVTSFGAKGDAKTDDTKAFQAALDSAAEKGGIVFVPAGTYLIAGTLNVPQGVTLRGVWESPHHADIGKGTLIYATGEAGKEDGTPLISLNQSSCIKGITIFYPDQDIDNVKAYPWTIRGSGMHCSVIDVTLVNSYKGIDFGTNWNELHYVRNVFGCVLKVGIYINQTTDIGRIENVHFNPHSWQRADHPNAPKGKKWDTLLAYLPENFIGFIIGKTDWEYMNNCFVIFPKIGYHFIRTANGDGNAVLTQCGSDICPVSVQVDASQSHAGIAFSNCQIMATVVVGPENNGPVKFSNCGFWPIETTDSQAIIEGGGNVTFSSCHFSGWANKNEKAPAISVKSGSVIVNGCDFTAEGKNQIELGQSTRSAAIVGCRFAGGEKIINNAPDSAKVQIGLNVE